MLTARADRQSTITGLDCGAVDYNSKPFDMTELTIKISGTILTLPEESVRGTGSSSLPHLMSKLYLTIPWCKRL